METLWGRGRVVAQGLLTVGFHANGHSISTAPSASNRLRLRQIMYGQYSVNNCCTQFFWLSQ